MQPLYIIVLKTTGKRVYKARHKSRFKSMPSKTSIRDDAQKYKSENYAKLALDNINRSYSDQYINAEIEPY
jgi:hypothetical protein